MDYRPEELLIAVIARLLEGLRHIAVGVLSPIPGSAALLAQARSDGRTKVSIIGSHKQPYRADGGIDLFDCAGQGRVDAFFLSGGQIDGQANVNLVGVGDYPEGKVRWSGSFGSAYLYFLVPRVILFREEHTRRVLVEKVDFVSAPGTSPPNVYRPGGPYALLTSRCLFLFDRSAGRFHLKSLHPGHTLKEVRDHTGFTFDAPATIPETVPPNAQTLELIRTTVARRIADPYPKFAREMFGVTATA
jgi:glutaconate CoA-transferase subunit B